LVDDPEAVLVDVRETEERQNGRVIPGSIHAPRGLLEFKADPESPIYNDAFNPARRIILYSGNSGRSALAAKTLLDMGFSDVSTLAGGYEAWHVAKV
jgi:rhodanese-related sulfurtransferase